MFTRRAPRWAISNANAVTFSLARSPQTALAWAWPVDGQVLREFSVQGDKYAAGQHRGIDVALGEAPAIRAPASGEV